MARARDTLASYGVDSKRIELRGSSSHQAHLATFHEVDIALDPFPQNGGISTWEALWMGVPVVTLAGRLSVQCNGRTVLAAAGLADLVAETPEDYLRIALFLAGTVPKMPDLRANVRRALQSSPLMDETGLVKDVEDAYRNMWRRWCK